MTVTVKVVPHQALESEAGDAAVFEVLGRQETLQKCGNVDNPEAVRDIVDLVWGPDVVAVQNLERDNNCMIHVLRELAPHAGSGLVPPNLYGDELRRWVLQRSREDDVRNHFRSMGMAADLVRL